MASIVVFFLLYSHLLLSVADQLSPAYSGEIATIYGPSGTSEAPDCRVSMGERSDICNGPLTGFQILKFENSLALPNPSPPSRSSPFRSLKNILPIVLGILGIVVIIILAYGITRKTNQQRALTGALRCFSLDEVRSATEDFNRAALIGRGGYGEVYRGLIDNRQRAVAIKRLSWCSLQGAREFWTEVKALSKLRHPNLVSLIGYCNESREMILVYEFMPLGTLADNLYKSNPKTHGTLSWEQRLRICIGAARGLDYLHTGTDHEVIHRDVKSSNILLDKEFKTKISDFGLAKIRESVQLHSHVSTAVKGTPGYVDPAYRASRQLTRKSDVYSFGVVLFEVLCGRKAAKSRDQLISWARGLIHDGHIEQIVDSRLAGQISPKCLTAFVEISEKCLHDEPKNRPTMVQLVAKLELLLEAHVGKNDAEILQGRETQCLDAPVIVAQPNILEAPRRGTKANMRETSSDTTSSSGRCHCFSISDIVDATGNFSRKNLIINDELYKIYRGGYHPKSEASHIRYKGNYTLKSLATNLAMAQVNCAKAGMAGISTELENLSYVHHTNIASMVGYCCSNGEVIIVYEHDDSGTLLQNLNRSNLPWIHRLSVCIGAARALRYLHKGTGKKIIHGDVSPTTILLDNKCGAKVLTFCSILSQLNTRNATELKHMPPKFADSTKLTDKSDVYLFGLLLLVVLCGNKAYHNYKLGRYPLHLPGKVRKATQHRTFSLNAKEKKTLHRITDLNPEVDIAEECLSKFLDVAFSCLNHEQVCRPSMGKVVKLLEEALFLQMGWENHKFHDTFRRNSAWRWK